MQSCGCLSQSDGWFSRIKVIEQPLGLLIRFDWLGIPQPADNRKGKSVTEIREITHVCDEGIRTANSSGRTRLVARNARYGEPNRRANDIRWYAMGFADMGYSHATTYGPRY